MSEHNPSENEFIHVFKKFAKNIKENVAAPKIHTSNVQNLLIEAVRAIESNKPTLIQGSASAYTPRRRKRNRLKDTHTSQSYNIQNEILEIINELSETYWEAKYRLVNEALKLYIFTHHKEHYNRIPPLED